MRFTLNDVAVATGGTAVGDAVVDGLSIDSRTTRVGELFVPIVAARDGHDFVDAAIERGAAAYLTMRGAFDGDTPHVRVGDTATALLSIGAAARARLPERVVGVTGSVGKTSTKDLLAAVLATRWATAANERSFNNELGVPITLAGAPDGTEAAVIEMGARGSGHIAKLCAVARPTVGVVTVVRGAHLELFGDLDVVAQAKGELVAALPASGTAVLNADDPRVVAMARRSAASVVRFGVESAGADVRAEGVTVDDDLRASFNLVSPWGSAAIRLAARGRHQVVNALAAAAAGLVCEVSLDGVVHALSTAELSPSRMALRVAANGLRVLDDAYNANPASMAAAIDALADLPARRRVAVLGTMAELGPGAGAAHREAALHARAAGIEVVAVGEERYGTDVVNVSDWVAAVDWVRAHDLGDGDAVLCKASHSVGLERVAAALCGDDV